MSKEKEKQALAEREDQAVAREEGQPIPGGTYYSPAVDIIEDDDGVTLVADLPGVRKEDVDIEIEDRVLTITGHARQPAAAGEPLRQEHGFGGYTRRFTLSDKFDRAKFSAGLVDGVLTVTLPKASSLKPRKIAIKAA